MFKLAKPFFMLVETPLHAGSGSDLGVIDLPIQRERHTGFPKVEASSLKGSIRQAFEELKDIDGTINAPELRKIFPGIDESWRKPIEYRTDEQDNHKRYDQAISFIFGPENGDLHAGALGFTDARLLLFPVKSVRGVFAWITCPRVLHRMANDLKLAGIDNIPEIPRVNTVPKNCQLIVSKDSVILEEYAFKVNKDDNDKAPCSILADWLAANILPKDPMFNFWREKMKKDIIILPDDDFRDFSNFSTEVITRTKINNQTGTVQQGALFTEEYIPSDSILYSLAMASPIFAEKGADKGVLSKDGIPEEAAIMDFFTAGMPQVIQLGGNATIGKGLLRVRIMEVNKHGK